MNSSDSIKVGEEYFNLLFSSPPEKVNYAYSVLSPFYDSIPLVSEYYDELITLMKYESYRSAVLQFSVNLLKENKPALAKQVQSVLSELLKNANATLEDSKVKFKEDEYYYSPDLLGYLNLLKEIDVKEFSDEFSDAFRKNDYPNYLRALATAVRIRNNYKINKKELKHLLSENYSSWTLVKAYNRAGRTDELDDKYTSFEYLAESAFYSYISDDGEPDFINYKGKINYNNLDYAVFSFGWEYDGQKDEYLGCSGPFLTDKKKTNLEDLKGYSDWSEVTPDWESSAVKMIPDLESYGY